MHELPTTVTPRLYRAMGPMRRYYRPVTTYYGNRRFTRYELRR